MTENFKRIFMITNRVVALSWPRSTSMSSALDQS